MNITLSLDKQIDTDEVIHLYQANHWSSAQRPQQLMAALRNSHTLVTARIEGKLVGLCNAISDGYLVVYYPHILVLPEYQSQGIGKQLMNVMLDKYTGFHQHMLTADGKAIDFYRSLGFERAGHTEPMWIYAGNDH